MTQTRRQIEKIQVPVRRTFDQEFWPVLIALAVLCGIAGGAILTLMHGPWMWGSLLVLPALAAIAIYLLYRLDDARLKRSLQLAILISLGLHLAILMFASITHIFNNPYQPERPKIAQKDNKTIVISQRQNNFIWQQSNKRTTPEPKVETQREQTQTNSNPQTVPVESQQQPVTPQVVRRETTRPTIPRLDQQTSQLRRQAQNVKPTSTAPAAAASVTSKVAEQEKSVRPVEPRETSSAARQSTSASAASKAAEASRNIETNKMIQPMNRRRESELVSAAPASKSKPMSRIRRSSAKMPKMASSAVPTASSSSAKPVNRQAESVETAVTRKSAEPTARKSQANPKPKDSSAVVASARREQSTLSQQTLSKPEMTSTTPRTTTTQAQLAATTANMMAPSRPVSAKTQQPRQPSPASLSVSRSTAGTAGAGRSANLDRGVGGVASPARVASDSSHSRRMENRSAENISLASQQQSEIGRSTALALKPQSSFKADTADMAKIAGSQSPSLVSESSSAATIDSATAQRRSESVSEKGESQIDLGPTKIVKDRADNRRSGGGMPDIAESTTETNQPAGRQSSDKTPTQIAAAGIRTEGPLNPSSMPTKGQENQNRQADEIARADSPEISEPLATAAAADTESQSSASQTSEIAENQSRNETDWSLDPMLMDEDPEQQNQNQGNARTILSQAPNVSRTVDFGFENPAMAQGRESNAVEGDSLAAEVLRRAANSMTGSAISRSAGTAMVQAVTSMPLIDTGSTGNRREGQAVNAEPAESQSNSTDGRRSNLLTPKLAAGATPSASQQQQTSSTQFPAIQSMGNQSAEEISRNGSDAPGAALDIDAVAGPAGLSETPSVRLGVRTRPASTDSDNIATDSPTRFRRKDFGGVPAINPDAVLARDAFRQRQPSAAASAPPSTEAAIQSGLEFLSRYQMPDGSWTLGQFDVDHELHQSQLNSDTAATGLALLAFQGAGYNHREFKYARQLQQAIDWMMANQAPDGGLYLDADEKSNGAARLYSHAIAALALTEAYGMTQDPKLRKPAQNAINYIFDTQDSKRGGWRYFADSRRRSTDTSVTGWMMMALVSGRLSGLDVDDKAFEGIENWLELARAGESEYEFRYNPLAVDSGGVSRLYGRKASPSMTAVGLLMRVYSGWDRNDPRFQRGAQTLLKQLPSDANALMRDTYYWYYATQVLKHAGGESWQIWNGRLQPLLVRSQEKEGDMRGSWDPYQPIPDRWGPHGGRLYVTAMNLLSLEVRYRLLPLYDKTIK